MIVRNEKKETTPNLTRLRIIVARHHSDAAANGTGKKKARSV